MTAVETENVNDGQNKGEFQPLLSVIVPVYNGANKLEGAVHNIESTIAHLHDTMWAVERERSNIEYSLLKTGDFPKELNSQHGNAEQDAGQIDSDGTTTSTKQNGPGVAALSKWPIQNWYEIIIVNDGSTDNTLDKIDKIRESGTRIRCISYRVNRGKGHAIKRGVLKSTGRYILFMDGDGDIGADVLTKYIKRLAKVHIVIGSKNHKKSEVKAPASRRFLSKCFQLYAKVLLGLSVGDTQVGLKAGRGEVFRSIFKQVQVDRYAFDTEMLAIADLMGVKVAELPVKINLDKAFKKKEIIRMALDVLRVAFRLRVKKSYQAEVEMPKASLPTVAEA